MSRNTKIFLFAISALIVAAGTYAALGHHDSSLGQRVNSAFDDLQAAGVRLLDLPLFMLLGASAILVGIGVIAVEKIGFGGVKLRRAAPIGASVILLMGLALVVDHRIAKLQMENDSLRSKMASARMTVMDGDDEPAPAQTAPAKAPVVPEPVPAVKVNADPVKPPTNVTLTPTLAPSPMPAASTQPKSAKRTAVMYDRDAARTFLAANFGSPDLRPVIYNQAIDLVKVQTSSPLTVAYLTIIDLTLPGVEVRVGGDLKTKTLTSEYAKANDCVIAINGEAGVAPLANTGLGTWTGHFISAGQTFLKEVAGNPRPFLSFDKSTRPTFIPLASKDRTVPAGSYNVIWGRLDALIKGEVQTDPERNRQPRTAMAINKEGTRLYLMVVDGRQQRYSIGFTRAEVGLFLKAFGGSDGMLCDEGGSSCLYTKLWGIINSPSDGEERVTYTHVGIVAK